MREHLPGLPYGQMMKLLRTGQFRLDGRRVEPGTRITAGQVVRIPPPALPFLKTPGAERPRPLPERDRHFVRSLVRFADGDILVIDKPAGLAVQGGPKTHRHLDGLLDALAEGGERPRLVHRLDRDTAGVMVLARNRRAAQALMEAFRSGVVEKTYWAIVLGKPRNEGIVDLPLGKTGPRGEERMSPEAPDARRAITRFRVIERASDRAAWLELEPKTGRTHQLRAHCAYAGFPIMGDVKYGGTDARLHGAPEGLMLQAMAIAFPHPRTGRTFRFALEHPAPHLAAALRWWGMA
ncbi:Ribosomal large subunit pseudouridine synthase C [bacterium HR39]|nr:Ribosomal large subunit pseudouridine synthase C [bacterium HR39]